MFMLRIRFDTFCTVPVIASSAPMRRARCISQPPQACRLLACASRAIGVISTSENRPESLSSVESRLSSLLACSSRYLAISPRSSVLRCVKYLTESHGLPPLPSASLRIREGGSTMKYLLSILIIAVVASQAMIWQSLVSIREAIQQGNAIIVAACGSDERPCQVAARRGQVELGEIMVRTRITDGFSCGYSRFNPCWTKPSAEDEV